MPPAPLTIGGTVVRPGRTARVEIPAARLPTGTWLSLPVTVMVGAKPGPRVWLDAAIHGDELNGMEIIRRVLRRLDPKRLAGAVVAVPIVNVFGFVHQNRYLPDRRDLNRSFPGSAKGSLASRMARLFLSEIVDHCQVGIDLHTGSQHRTNLPHIRARLDDPETRRLAEAFGAPMLYQAPLLAGSLRAACDKRGIPLLVYEGGEPMRFNRRVIEVGEAGVLRVIQALGMTTFSGLAAPVESFRPAETRWVRASRSGILRLAVEVGERVAEGAVLGRIADPLATRERALKAPFAGMVIGHNNNPLVHQGEAIVHLAREVGPQAGDGNPATGS